MLYHLLFEELFPVFSPFRVFGYITFRTAFASFTALALGLILGPWMIRRLREFQVGQHIREDGPRSHQSKAGTPTMGGLLINVSILLPTLLWANLTNVYVWIALLGLVGFGAIGFLDDTQRSGTARTSACKAAARSPCRSW
jgi:phospho-N-acetylmuramoyl-pentapeptide-transferase